MIDISFIPQLEMALTELPEISFKSGLHEISNAVNSIGDMVELHLPMSNMTKEDRAKLIIERAAITLEALHNTPEYHSYFAPLSKLASKLGENVLSTFNILKDSIQPEVETLKNRIEELTALRLKEDNRSIVITDTPKVNTDFNTVNWDEHINRMGGAQNIIDSYNNISGGFGVNFSVTDLQVALKNIHVEPITLDPEAKSDTLNRLHVVSNELPNEEIDKLFELICDPYLLAHIRHEVVEHIFNSNIISYAIPKIIDIMDNKYDVVRRMKNVPLNLLDEYVEKIHNNIDQVLNIFMLAAYSFLIIRKHYGSALIIDSKTINGDTYPDFTSRGGNLDDVGMYIAIYYPNGNIPDSGVSVSEIIATKEATAEKYQRMVSSFALDSKSILHRYTVSSLNEVLSAYLHETDVTRLPENISVEQFVLLKKGLIKQAANSLDSSEDYNLDNVLYTFVINTHYEGTAVMSAHKLFGSEMVKQIQSNNELDDTTFGLIDAKVAAAICSDFIVSELCDIKK